MTSLNKIPDFVVFLDVPQRTLQTQSYLSSRYLLKTRDLPKMILIGKNLGERHRDLNSKVAEAVASKTNYEELKYQSEQCDVDKLFKINLASKYQDIGYILEVLKCGDVFYITHALKCLWLYDNKYSQFINAHYLETNIFSCMSAKMKRKMLTSIFTHITDADRCLDFYNYCKQNNLDIYAVKFLVNTPDNFKLEILKDKDNFNNFDQSKYLKPFVGHSFVIAVAYLRLYDYSSIIVHELRFLYSLSDEQYLEILEKYIHVSVNNPNCLKRLGIRISKDILKRHKEKIVKRPLLYVNILNKSMLVKHLTIEDVKSFSLALLPNSSTYFWSMDFYHTYKFIFEKFNASERLVHIKQIYITNYNDDTFEMRVEFYNLKYYEMFNIEEREVWALKHIELDKELPGIENYIWYKFVSLEKGFSGIKRYIFLTPDKYKRSEILNILAETARDMEDINKILVYYYERHVNESEDYKLSFINKIIECHDIYSFSDECWTSLDDLLYSLDVYTTGCYTREEYKFRSMVYHILYAKELPDALKEYIDYITHFYDTISLVDELSEERKIVVAKYLINNYANKIESLMDNSEYETIKDKDDFWEDGSIKNQIHRYVRKVWNIIDNFKISNEECPEIVMQFMEANKSFYSYHEIYKPKFVKSTEEDFVRCLKQDLQTVVEGIDQIRCNTFRWDFRLCRLFRKLKVYFPNDVGKKYLEYFMGYLSDIPIGYRNREYRNIKMAVVAVFYLADLNVIISLLEKNTPDNPKIDHMNIDKRVLQVQKAICRLAYYPRPPVPLSYFKKYIAGDYVHFCLPVIYNYIANLQSNDKFIESLLDAPLSIQKHGLRLAFKAYKIDKLIPIIVTAWKKTKNVSLRMILYETLFDRLLNECEEVQKELYKVLKLYTSELNHDDHENVFSLLVSADLPDEFKGDFIETAWITVSKLPNKSVDVQRRASVIRHMEEYLHLVDRDFARLQIIDGHVNDILYEKNICRDDIEYHDKELINAKWNLTGKYVITFANKVEQGKSLELVRAIMSQCMENWDIVKRRTYVIRKCMQKFIKTIMNKDPKSIESCTRTVVVYRCIQEYLQKYLIKEHMYLINWELQLSITCRAIICNGRNIDTGDWSTKEIANAYGKEIVKIIISFVKNAEFYRCFYQSIANIIIKIGNTFCEILDACSSGFVYYVCDSLTDTRMTETYVIALLMLPRDPSHNWEGEHAQSVTKIQQFDSHEIRSFLFEKYVLSDCGVRDYVK